MSLNPPNPSDPFIITFRAHTAPAPRLYTWKSLRPPRLREVEGMFPLRAGTGRLEFSSDKYPDMGRDLDWHQWEHFLSDSSFSSGNEKCLTIDVRRLRDLRDPQDLRGSQDPVKKHVLDSHDSGVKSKSKAKSKSKSNADAEAEAIAEWTILPQSSGAVDDVHARLGPNAEMKGKGKAKEEVVEVTKMDKGKGKAKDEMYEDDDEDENEYEDEYEDEEDDEDDEEDDDDEQEEEEEDEDEDEDEAEDEDDEEDEDEDEEDDEEDEDEDEEDDEDEEETPARAAAPAAAAVADDDDDDDDINKHLEKWTTMPPRVRRGSIGAVMRGATTLPTYPPPPLPQPLTPSEEFMRMEERLQQWDEELAQRARIPGVPSRGFPDETYETYESDEVRPPSGCYHSFWSRGGMDANSPVIRAMESLATAATVAATAGAGAVMPPSTSLAEHSEHGGHIEHNEHNEHSRTMFANRSFMPSALGPSGPSEPSGPVPPGLSETKPTKPSNHISHNDSVTQTPLRSSGALPPSVPTTRLPVLNPHGHWWSPPVRTGSPSPRPSPNPNTSSSVTTRTTGIQNGSQSGHRGDRSRRDSLSSPYPDLNIQHIEYMSVPSVESSQEFEASKRRSRAATHEAYVKYITSKLEEDAAKARENKQEQKQDKKQEQVQEQKQVQEQEQKQEQDQAQDQAQDQKQEQVQEQKQKQVEPEPKEQPDFDPDSKPLFAHLAKNGVPLPPTAPTPATATATATPTPAPPLHDDEILPTPPQEQQADQAEPPKPASPTPGTRRNLVIVHGPKLDIVFSSHTDPLPTLETLDELALYIPEVDNGKSDEIRFVVLHRGEEIGYATWREGQINAGSPPDDSDLVLRLDVQAQAEEEPESKAQPKQKRASGAYGLKPEDAVASSTLTPAPIDFDEERERPLSPSILSEWSYPPSPEPEPEVEVENETLAKSLTSGEYLSTLIAASQNSTASTRLLRILRDENVALDTSIGLKLLDLAKALRTDGELAPTPQQAAGQVPKSGPELVAVAEPTPISTPQCEKYHPTERMLLHVLDRLNDHSGMLNAIAEASGVDLLENDDGYKDECADESDDNGDDDGDGDGDEVGSDIVADETAPPQARRFRFGCSMISENDGPLDFGDDLPRTAGTVADVSHSNLASTETNEQPRSATYPTCEDLVDAPPTPTLLPKMTLADHPWYRRSTKRKQLAPAKDKEDRPTSTPTMSPPFGFASVLHEEVVENRNDHDLEHDHERERQPECQGEHARGQDEVQGRHLYNDDNGHLRCNYYGRYDSRAYRPLPQIPTRDTTGWHGSSAASWPSQWPAMYSYSSNAYSPNYGPYTAPHATPTGHSGQGHQMWPYRPQPQSQPHYTASPPQNPSAAGWYSHPSGF